MSCDMDFDMYYSLHKQSFFHVFSQNIYLLSYLPFILHAHVQIEYGLEGRMSEKKGSGSGGPPTRQCPSPTGMRISQTTGLMEEYENIVWRYGVIQGSGMISDAVPIYHSFAKQTCRYKGK
jgi:hypothetical protein